MLVGLNKSASRGGNTLIELVIVILVGAITAAVAVPKWAAMWESMRADYAAKRIVADLSRAQSSAYATSSTKTVTFITDTSQYSIAGVTDLDRASATYSVRLSDTPYRATLISVWNAKGTQSISFDGFGVPNCGGSIVVGAGNSQRTIQVDAATGAAVIQ